MTNLIDDHAIMLKVKQGEVEQLSLLYHRYSRRLFGFFYRMVGDSATCEDLVQNVFMRMLKYKHSYAESGQFESWAFHIARNVHRDHYRKLKRYDFQENMTDWEAHLKEEHNKEADFQQTEELNMLSRAMKSLSIENQELLELTRFQMLKYGQVADILGITESAVKVRVYRAIKALKENYQKLDGREIGKPIR